jgi:hypothetical protein
VYKDWKSRVGVLALTATMGLALVGIASPAGAADPNAAAKALCKNDGWKTLVRADGTRFLSQGECVSYAANGGTPMPPVPALHLTYDGTAVAAYATFTGGSLGAGCNTFALTCDDTTSFASGDYIRMSVQMSCTSTCPDTLSIVAFYNNTSAYGKFDCNNTGTPTDLVCETTVFTDVGDTAVNVTIAS